MNDEKGQYSVYFWAREIFLKLERVFLNDDVNFERFHDMVARQIAGRQLPGCRTLFECRSSHQEQPQQCCKNKETILKMIYELQDYLLENILDKTAQSDVSRSRTVNVPMEDDTGHELLEMQRATAFKDITTEDFFATDSEDSFQSSTYFESLESVLRGLISR